MQQHATTREDLESIMLNERSQSQKTINCEILLIKLTRIDKSIDTESELVVG